MADIEKLDAMNAATDAGSARRQDRQQRRGDQEQGGGGWLAGLVLITIGVLYLLIEYDVLPPFTNWWALFLLLPGLGTLSAALGAYRRTGSWSAEVIAPFVASLFFFTLTAIFLLDIDYSRIWPLFLIGGGLLLVGASTLARR